MWSESSRGGYGSEQPSQNDPVGAKSTGDRFDGWDFLGEVAFGGLAYGLYAATKAATHTGAIAAGLLAAAIGGCIFGLSVVVARWILIRRVHPSEGSKRLTLRSTVMLLAATTTLVTVGIMLTLAAAYAQK